MTNRNVVLIDYENVPLERLDPIENYDVEVWLFAGHQQRKIPTEIVIAMQKLGYKARYVQSSGGGKNALDFHMAFYAGELATTKPKPSIYIISHDKGFDPLIRHLTGDKDIDARRVNDVWDLPFIDPPAKEPLDDLMEKIISNFRKRGHARPRKVSTLKNTLAHNFSAVPGAPKATTLIKKMIGRNLIEVDNDETVRYHPPITKT